MKNNIIYFLSEFCGQNPIEEKIFIVPSYRLGRQIGESLAARESPWINLRFMTLPALLDDVIGIEAAVRGLKQISGAASLFLIERIFRDLKTQGLLEYFSSLETSTGIIKAILRSMKSLRMSGISSENMNPENFVNEKKGREIKLILEKYEEELKRNNTLDLPGLYRLAVEQMDSLANKENRIEQKKGGPFYLCLQEEVLSLRERLFIEKLAGDKLFFIPRGAVYGLERPRRYWPVKETKPPPVVLPPTPQPKTDLQRMPWLFDPENPETPLPFQDGTIELFSAVGTTCECKEVFRKIIQADYPLDEVEILHPPKSLYPLTFFAMGLKAGFKVTFSEGLAIGFTTPGGIFNGLLEWLKNNYLSDTLCHLIESGSLLLYPIKSEDHPSPYRMSRYIKNAMIGWGRERYLPRLKALKESVQCSSEIAEKQGDQEKSDIYGRSAGEIEWLVGLIESFLALIPDQDENGCVVIGILCQGISSFLKTFTQIKGALDTEALSALTSRLNEAALVSHSTVPWDEAIEWIQGLGKGLCAGASGPIPGHIHLASYSNGGYTGRPVTFIVGLDQGAFPGSGLQDPLLLDEERKKISNSLPTTADILRENLYSMASMLASLRGRVVLSYSSYDVIDDRESFPSSLLLQAFRLIKGDASLDYSDLMEALPESAGMPPQDQDRIFDETDWWLNNLVKEGRLLEGREAVKALFHELSRGVTALDARRSSLVTEFDGKIEVGKAEFHPYVNANIVLSSSGLELLAGCPFRYFLNYILGISKPDELEYDPSRWLDPLQRGTLIHEILQIFMETLREKGAKADPEKHLPLIQEIAEQCIQRMREEIPPPSEGIFFHEKSEILDSLQVFLAAEHSRTYPVEPILFEAAFGMSPRKSSKNLTEEICEGIEEPVEIYVEGKNILRIRGKIDRLDRIGQNVYRVVDYKTGSFANYENLTCFGRGQTLQHVLYSIAAECILKKLKLDDTPKVVKSGYYFPTRRGEGREILIEREKWTEYAGLLQVLMNILKQGFFLISPDAFCNYCEFAPICGAKAKDHAKEKKQHCAEEYAVFNKLKEYE